MAKIRIALLLAAIFSLPALGQNKMEYLIKIDQPVHHLANIRIKIPQGHASVLLKLPTWRTGNYHILDQANGIRNFKAATIKGNKLQWKRVDKSSWQIDNPTNAAVRVSYLLYANELGKRTRHIDETHAYLDATAVLMYEPSLMNIPHQVQLQVDKKWRSFSGMKQISKNNFLASNYDQLADSPIEVGLNKRVEFSQDGRDYQVVFWGAANRDYEKIGKDIKTMVAASQTIWSGYPFKKYLFIIHATSGEGGATEHVNSTVIQRSRDLFAKKDDYLNKFLRTAAHEFVHTWNVKAYRPKGLVPYNYQSENYSNLFWIAEGSTSYFEDRLLLVSKLESVNDYLKSLSKRIDQFKRTPGHTIQSVSSASQEEWIAQGGDFARNYSTNIYREGFLASWLLDFKLLQESKLKVSYRDIHQALFKQKQTQKKVVFGYDRSILLALLKQKAGYSFEKWWQQNIEQPMAIDFEGLLDKAGLQFEKLEDEDYKVWTGFTSSEIDGLISFDFVERNSPAWKAGLTVNDQLLAVNGYKVTQDNLAKWLKQFEPGETINLTLFREQKLITRKIKLGKVNTKPRVVETNPKASQQQKAFFKAWLGVDFPAEEKD